MQFSKVFETFTYGQSSTSRYCSVLPFRKNASTTRNQQNISTKFIPHSFLNFSLVFLSKFSRLTKFPLSQGFSVFSVHGEIRTVNWEVSPPQGRKVSWNSSWGKRLTKISDWSCLVVRGRLEVLSGFADFIRSFLRLRCHSWGRRLHTTPAVLSTLLLPFHTSAPTTRALRGSPEHWLSYKSLEGQAACLSDPSDSQLTALIHGDLQGWCGG